MTQLIFLLPINADFIGRVAYCLNRDSQNLQNFRDWSKSVLRQLFAIRLQAIGVPYEKD
jgi:hypothetical protein